MKIIKNTFMVTLIVWSLTANSQESQKVNEDSLHKVQTDSLQRSMMKDSLGLTDQVITQVFALRDTCFSRTDRIRTNNHLSQLEQMDHVQNLRSQTEESIRLLMGEIIYLRYTEMLMGRRRPG